MIFFLKMIWGIVIVFFSYLLLPTSCQAIEANETTHTPSESITKIDPRVFFFNFYDYEYNTHFQTNFLCKLFTICGEYEFYMYEDDSDDYDKKKAKTTKKPIKPPKVSKPITKAKMQRKLVTKAKMQTKTVTKIKTPKITREMTTQPEKKKTTLTTTVPPGGQKEGGDYSEGIGNNDDDDDDDDDEE